MSRHEPPPGFGQCTDEQCQGCTECGLTRKRLCAALSETFDPGRGPRWRGGDHDAERYGTPLAHQAVRLSLGPSMAPVFRSFIVACSWTMNDSYLLQGGRMTIARFALALDVSEDTARDHVDKLCCLDLLIKLYQRHVLPPDNDPDHPNAIALYVANRLPAWAIENIELIDGVRKATSPSRRDRARRRLREHQDAVRAQLDRELRRGFKTQPRGPGTAR